MVQHFRIIQDNVADSAPCRRLMRAGRYFLQSRTLGFRAAEAGNFAARRYEKGATAGARATMPLERQVLSMANYQSWQVDRDDGRMASVAHERYGIIASTHFSWNVSRDSRSG